jgi:Flp pilus assembly pilin Flp
MIVIVALCRVATMKNAKYLARLFVRDTSGATAIEYGIIAGVMGLMLIPVMTVLATSLSGLFLTTKGFFDTVQQ